MHTHWDFDVGGMSPAHMSEGTPHKSLYKSACKAQAQASTADLTVMQEIGDSPADGFAASTWSLLAADTAH